MKRNEIEYNNILKFIDNISNYSDEEILNKVKLIVKYLDEINDYKLKYKFLILVMCKIKNVDMKANLIITYCCSKFEGLRQRLYDWESIQKVLKNINDKDKEKIFSKIFSDIKVEKVSQILNIPINLKFGVELEYNYPLFKDIKLLYTSGMIIPIMKSLSFLYKLIYRLSKNVDFEKENEFDKWIFSKEINNDELPEASSPIMTNNLDCLNQIAGIVTLFNAFGSRVHGGTGLHINIGADYFGDNVEALKYLLIIWSECEELFFKIANAENDVIRVMAINMAAPIKENIQKTLEENLNIKFETDEDVNKFMYSIQVRNRLNDLLGFDHGDLEFELMKAKTEEDKYEIFKKYIEQKSEKDTSIRYTSINFNHMTWNSKDKGRIEFRLFNSSLSIDIILQNLLLIGKLCEVSLELANNSKNKLIKFNELLKHNITEEEKLDSLLNLLFDIDEEKQIFKKRWISVKDNPSYEKYKTGKRTFTKSKKMKKVIKKTFDKSSI